MLSVNPKKIKAYGDRLDDGVIQLSFTLPVSASPEAKETAKQLLERHGFQEISVATMQPMGKGFTFFVVYARSQESVDFSKIHVPKIEMPEMDYASLTAYMARHLERPIVVIGATTGADAHTVGIDAIMNMKGYAGDYGLERYPLFKTHNLRSQLTNDQLLAKAVELSADAILVSQVVTQRDSHVKNLREFLELFRKEPRLGAKVTLIVGGPRLDHPQALKLGFDAGFGTGTKPSQVANFIIREFMKRHGIREKPAEAKEKSERKWEPVRHPAHEVRAAPPPPPPPREDTEEEAIETPPPGPAQAAEGEAPGGTPEAGSKRRRRRRGRRGGRRHRKQREKQGAPAA